MPAAKMDNLFFIMAGGLRFHDFDPGTCLKQI